MKQDQTSSKDRTEDLTPEESLARHYRVEKELAARLRTSTKEQRRTLYNEVYDELIARVPDHPTLRRQTSPQATAARARLQMDLMRKWLRPEQTLLEVGPGDCAFAHLACSHVRRVLAVDVAQDLTQSVEHPPNFEFITSDGTSVPVPEDSVDVAYSNQVMEHLHPDDALEQAANIFRAIKPNGIYVCVTPNRLSGPHDVSRTFDDVATGLHLREYTATEVSRLMRSVGFRAVRLYITRGGAAKALPNWVIMAWEGFVGALPGKLRRKLAGAPVLRALVRSVVVATK